MNKQAHVFQLIQPTNLPSTHSNCPPSLRNIFLISHPEKVSESELHNSKSYDLVGLRQLKAYKKRTKKRTKVTMRDREDMHSERTLSRASCQKQTKIDPYLLNKEEVIDCLPPISRQQSSLILSKRNGPIIQNLSKVELKKNYQQTISFRNQFSVERIKNRLQEQQNEWQRLLYTRKEGEKFPTLGDSIIAYGRRMEAACKTGIDDNLVNVKSSYWGNTLRNGCDINDICFPPKDTRTLHEGIKAKGNSKLLQETHWIQGKDQQGFRFKNYPDTSLPLPSIKPNPR